MTGYSSSLAPRRQSVPPLLERRPAVRLAGLGTATPPETLTQEEALEFTLARCAANPQQADWIRLIFRHAGVKRRAFAILDGALPAVAARHALYPPQPGPGPGTAARLEQYAALAVPLAGRACQQALLAARLAPAEITHLVPVSCTGFFAPGLDIGLIRGLDLDPGVRRAQIGFMGCHAAFNALAVARDMVLADPAARVLVCCVELCGLHLAYGFDPQRMIANALFADGAAAAVVTHGQSPAPSKGVPAGDQASWRLLATASYLIPDCAQAMTWRIGDQGFEMGLSPAVPGLIGRHIAPWLHHWLDGLGLAVRDIANWAIHPGGPKVLSAVTAALDLPSCAADTARQILADHGNMSSATILFILDRLAHQRQPGPTVALGFGPGLMAEAMLLM